MNITTEPRCGYCDSPSVVCVECGWKPTHCDCGDDDIIIFCNVCGTSTETESGEYYIEDPNSCVCLDEPLKLVCNECQVFRYSHEEPWRMMENIPSCVCENADEKARCPICMVVRDEHDQWQWECTEDRIGYYSYTCRHYNVPLKFPDGVTVYASSEHTREPLEMAPDFGLYASPAWQASCLAYFIDWQDYHLPVRWQLAAHAIVDTYNKARAGLWVEVGCFGGHGRTGTILACMAVLGGIPATDAVDWVRQNYCEKAVEADTQEWWVLWFDAYINGKSVDDHKEAEDFFPRSFQFPMDWKDYDPFQPFTTQPTDAVTEVARNTHFIKKEYVQKASEQ